MNLRTMAWRFRPYYLLVVALVVLSLAGEVSPQSLSPGSVVSCENAKADVVFVVDSSGSVREPNFRKMLEFIRGIILMFNIGIDYMRVALVRFNSQVIAEFQLNEFTHPENLLERLDMIEYTTGTTNMAGALRYLRRHSYKTENGGRATARKLAILISDGRSDNRAWTVTEARKCKEANITLFALGIGNSVDKDELQDVGSDPASKHVIFFDDFDALNGTQIAIATTVCTYSKPKMRAAAPIVAPPTGLDGGIIAGIVFGTLIFVCLILAYPGYLLVKKYAAKKKKKKKPKRPKTASYKTSNGKMRHRARSARGRRPPSSRSSDRSDSASTGRVHTHTPLRPGTSSGKKRKTSYGSFDGSGNYSRHLDDMPMRPLSRSSESSGSTNMLIRPGTSQGSSRRSSFYDGPRPTLPEGPEGSEGPANKTPGPRPLPPGLERAISMMRRQRTMTQHPAPGDLQGPGPGPGGALPPTLPPGMMLQRQGTVLMAAPRPGGPPPPGMIRREGTQPVLMRGPPPPPGALQRQATLIRAPPPGMLQRDGTMVRAPPPPGTMVMMRRREGTIVAPPPGALRREPTSAGGPPAPPPGGAANHGEARPNPPSQAKRDHQSIPEEADSPAKQTAADVHAPPPSAAADSSRNPKPAAALGPLPPISGSRLPPLKPAGGGTGRLPEEGQEEGVLNPVDLALRLKSLEEQPLPSVVSKDATRGQQAIVREDEV